MPLYETIEDSYVEALYNRVMSEELDDEDRLSYYDDNEFESDPIGALSAIDQWYANRYMEYSELAPAGHDYTAAPTIVESLSNWWDSQCELRLERKLDRMEK